MNRTREYFVNPHKIPWTQLWIRWWLILKQWMYHTYQLTCILIYSIAFMEHMNGKIYHFIANNSHSVRENWAVSWKSGLTSKISNYKQQKWKFKLSSNVTDWPVTGHLSENKLIWNVYWGQSFLNSFWGKFPWDPMINES